jgi:predicted SAM-dependent methyltransferase
MDNDPREQARAQLTAYREKHPDEVTSEMTTLWAAWLGEAWEVVSNARGDQEFFEEGPAQERWRLSEKYLRGNGVEVGALHNPLRVRDDASVTYIDKYSEKALALAYYEVAQYRFVEVDVLDDGERLETVADASYDFLISNHFLEHTQDPVGTLAAHARVLRPNGILYCAVPDARKSFDHERERTSFEHVWRDHEQGPEGSRRDHYRDWSLKVNGRSGPEHEAWWRLLDALDYSIHFHVWTPWDVLELFSGVRSRLGLQLDVREFVVHNNECVLILEKL